MNNAKLDSLPSFSLFLETTTTNVHFKHLGRWPATTQKAIRAVQSDSDGQVNFDEFREFYATYPIILDPAFKLQHRMQVRTLGEYLV